MHHDGCCMAGFMRVCLALRPSQHPSYPAHDPSGKRNGSPNGDITFSVLNMAYHAVSGHRLLRELVRDAYGTLGGRSQVE